MWRKPSSGGNDAAITEEIHKAGLTSAAASFDGKLDIQTDLGCFGKEIHI